MTEKQPRQNTGNHPDQLADRRHTRAPWRVEDINNYQGFDHLVGAAIVCDAHMIAEIRGATVIHGGVHEEHAANARLIAAAPYLLETLAALIAAIERPNSDEWLDDVQDKVNDGHAAVARATS